ncbi:hypothetical protein F0266_10540 [Vibrio coralliilyticus]|uniref:hypothetical protein n=1 Tax=Vibrio coralliilyticus TaxID=190893 RepID=UPI00148D22E5|nr:hypothetical protein [Vibrio coralliilyticus]NOH53371.1 hypothetical protein [Vibrio coralliilyticus]
MKQAYIIIGIPFCLWTIALAIENEAISYILLNVLLAIPKVPTIFSDLSGAIFDFFQDDLERSLKDAIEADRLASESELLNRKVYETTITVQPEVNEDSR